MPEQIWSFPTVPKLAEALQRCLEIEMDEGEFQAALDAFSADREQGASELARRALRILAGSASVIPATTGGELWALLEEQANSLAAARPSMAPVNNLLSRWLYGLRKHSEWELPQMRSAAIEQAEELIRHSETAVLDVAQRTARYLGPGRTLFTHSFSSTVAAVFEQLREQSVRAIITESRPLQEGYLLAGELSEWGIPATLITEAQAGLFIGEADAVVMGADSLLPDGSLVNKAGSYLVALAAQEQKVPFYVCCESFKRRSPEMGEPLLEEMEPVELGAPRFEGVEVKNCYFDITPSKLISGWIDEHKVRLSWEE
jgi:translation initiation factor 2B subunit (eIF-2B alpha/beta/delta family)